MISFTIKNLISAGMIDVNTTDVSQYLIDKLTDGKKNITEKRHELTVVIILVVLSFFRI